MIKTKIITFLVALFLLMNSALAAPEGIDEYPVQFEQGKSSIEIEGNIKGRQIIDYVLKANKGQTMAVTFNTGNVMSYFNVLPTGDPTALFIGSIHGNEWTGTLPQDGAYTIRVYLMRSAARRNESANFTLNIAITSDLTDIAPETDVKLMNNEPVTKTSFSLAGTSWRLESITSMDDAQGTVNIEAPSLYTIVFNKNGTANFHLNCNLAKSEWSIHASDDSQSGQLEFGILLGTRAICSPPSYDERVIRDMPYVYSYFLKDSHLHMSLMADGGIYSWKRVNPL